eukprot:m.54039 g.54039  ORF g.54039 m.54039 type:complete len:251 (+) comp18470_c0_seq3:351-1103(+)
MSSCWLPFVYRETHYPGTNRRNPQLHQSSYAKVVDKLKSLIAGKNVQTFIGRYNATYPTIDHPFWWDVNESGGPIVEQATHFIDLARYLCGDVDEDSVHAICVKATHPTLGPLEKIPEVVNENAIPEERRLPRATTASWTFQSGTIASLTHALLLQGTDYLAELEIWADGLRVVLEEMYTDKTRLRVREKGNDEDTVIEFGSDDDPYLTEDELFLRAINKNNPELVRSSYEDASKTYILSVLIRERSTKQ